MPSHFPGMNPYLERPDLWTEVHAWLIVELARYLNPMVQPKYRAAVEQRVYTDLLLIGIPDVTVFKGRSGQGPDVTTATVSQPVKVNLPMPEEVKETYLEIRQVGTGQVVTVIEVLSPKNKRSGEGRNQYNAKRLKILESQSHLVEIDLLRAGNPMPMSGHLSSDYRILVSRAHDRPEAELYPFNLRQPIPRLPLPLQAGDEEPVMDLKLLLQEIYEAAALDGVIDYNQQPTPPLSAADVEWMQTLR
ncbi:DUF4058 family protein [Synechococcales cyanobacterium C]|uniref:DUF4058 family protein n=1 Tax=Petrachloros mirabilis ULC683 TaxID=2781853 RepID=A0A8K1ZZ69_9CYAN|nr:DUF4058 family protein [Petrachloros mirabilis]NCJ07518.1 DUF4058 family protein [Petrachloros mirabilis ULC683]